MEPGPNTHFSLLPLPVPGAVSPPLELEGFWGKFSCSSRGGRSPLPTMPAGMRPQAFAHGTGLDFNAMVPACLPYEESPPGGGPCLPLTMCGPPCCILCNCRSPFCEREKSARAISRNHWVHAAPELELGELTTLSTIVTVVIIVTLVFIVTLSCLCLLQFPEGPLHIALVGSGPAVSSHRSLHVLLNPVALDDVLLGQESA